ncbi:MAG: FtsQ-type POTRA domain-containing protein [Candidatus Aminicenantes bacterium]|nr:FtsQ-type POTRA domain-containing protein [Candidatus Aminicenantes bacterium]
MASRINPALKIKGEPFYSQHMQFQRAKGKTKTKKAKRRAKLKFRHIFFYLLLIGGIFYSVQKSYLFLISWDKLEIKDMTVVCRNPEVKQEIQQNLENIKAGNILLFDIGHLQEELAAHRWVKEVRIRKIFPSTLRIEIKDRTPLALLKRENFYLIDEEGIHLERIQSREELDLPLLVDSNNFKKDYKEKLELAWECLRSLSPSEQEQLDVLDLSEYENIIVQLKKRKTWLILGNDRFSQKIKEFQKYSARLGRFGNLEYADLRFPDRFIIKPKKNPHKSAIPKSKREAN